MITIIDYGMGNLGSIKNMLKRIGAECQISSNARDILDSDKLILPGVGHFDKAMRNLRESGLAAALDEAVIQHRTPIRGICLGQQLMTRGSEEGDQPGFGWIPAEVRRFDPESDQDLLVPHMGWNTIKTSLPSPILDDCYPDSRYYFVHSFKVHCDSAENILAVTDYGGTFHSAIIKDHILGVQFHPEKSHKYGYRLMQNFAFWGTDSEEMGCGSRQLFSQTDVKPTTDNQATHAEPSVPVSTSLPVRVIPTLLLDGRGLVKTEKFKNPTYVGDPRNAVKIFNEKEVDELVIMDIKATEEDRGPDYELLGEIISEAFMPVAYGGGIRTIEQAKRLLASGVEKILLNTIAVENPDLVKEASRHFGAQSVVVVIDVRKEGLFRKENKVCYRRGSKSVNESPIDFARRMEDLGAGEIILQSIDREGTQQGYDLELIQGVTGAVNIPVIASGGAGNVGDFGKAVNQAGASGVTAGSLFVFQGRHRAVLINYPKPEVLRQTFSTEN